MVFRMAGVQDNEHALGWFNYGLGLRDNFRRSGAALKQRDE
jgi:hypothetical protein